MNYNYIESLVKQIKSGDNSSKEKLISEFEPFIINFSSKTHINGYAFEDVQSECYRILFKCVKLYNLDKHRFVAYATNGIKNSIYDLIRKSKTHEERNVTCSLASEDTTFVDLKDDVDIFNELCQKLDYTLLYSSLKKLSKDESALVIHIYYKNSTLRKFSKVTNIPYHKVLKMKANILAKLSHDLVGCRETFNFA